jgi:hypothetical protein
MSSSATSESAVGRGVAECAVGQFVGQGAVGLAQPATQAVQAGAGHVRVRVGRTGDRVDDRDGEQTSPPRHGDADGLAGRVPHRVRETFLNDAIRRLVSGPGQRARCVVRPHRHVNAGGAELRDEPADRGQPACWPAQNGDYLMQFGAAGPDRRTQLRGGLTLGRRQIGHFERRCLDRREAERAAERVVHVTGDPHPLAQPVLVSDCPLLGHIPAAQQREQHEHQAGGHETGRGGRPRGPDRELRGRNAACHDGHHCRPPQ